VNHRHAFHDIRALSCVDLNSSPTKKGKGGGNRQCVQPFLVGVIGMLIW